jgi:hypothetical protein
VKLAVYRVSTELKMTSYEFRGAQSERGSARRDENNVWGVGGWKENRKKKFTAQHEHGGLSLDRVHLKAADHLKVDVLNQLHPRGKTGGTLVFSQQRDHLACTTEAEVLNSVFDGQMHPAYRDKCKLNTHWSEGISRDGRGVAGEWSGNEHPDIKTSQHCWQKAQAEEADKLKKILATRGQEWLEAREPPVQDDPTWGRGVVLYAVQVCSQFCFVAHIIHFICQMSMQSDMINDARSYQHPLYT